MNTQEEIEKVVSQYMDLLPIADDKVSVQSEVKASKFLLAIAKLAAIRDRLLNQKVKKDSLRSVAFNEAIKSAVGGDAKTREAGAKANPNYLESNEEVDGIDNQLLYVKTMQDIFLNAHLLYRSMLKNEQ